MTPREVIEKAIGDTYDFGAEAKDMHYMLPASEAEVTDAILAALRDAGFAVVPMKPTEAMTLQGWLQLPRLRPDTGYVVNVYTAMLAAAEGEPR